MRVAMGGAVLKGKPSAAVRQPPIGTLPRFARFCTNAASPSSKVCVFSQSSQALRHIEVVLNNEQIPRRRNWSGQKVAASVASFSSEHSGVNVILLHAGAAAAGISRRRRGLFYSSRFCEQEKSCAINRTHRIGQSKEVKVITLYTTRTVEERMLARNPREKQFGGEKDRSDGATRLRLKR